MPSYLTTSDVAKRLDVSLDTVRRWLRSGELKGSPFGRAGYRIEDSDFQAFFNKRRRQPQEIPLLNPSAYESFPLTYMTIQEVMNALGHELRTPLTTTHSVLQQARRLLQQALEASLPDQTTTELLTKLQDILLQAERQMSVEMQLAENLLDASLIEANKFVLSPVWCNLIEIVQETVTTQQELTVQRVFQLEPPVEDLIAVMADPIRIKQALTSYLTNALKFSSPDQPIKISLEVHDAQAQIVVKDHGPGIPDTEQRRIWERFQKGRRQPIGTGSGLGLGLYITRAIIHQHQGYVGVESHPGEGSTFWFTLPLAD